MFSALDITPPDHQSLPPECPTVVVCHGLTGGSHESYVRNILVWVARPRAEGGLGGRGVVVNFRGCKSIHHLHAASCLFVKYEGSVLMHLCQALAPRSPPLDSILPERRQILASHCTT